MPDYGQELRFGVFIPPAAAQAADVLELARLVELEGLDLVTFQDHPYQPRFLDAWTLVSVVAGQTSTVRLALNVANLPLRPPAVLARSVAALDILSGGRVELGLGAGAFWDGIVAMGGPRRTPGQSVDALGEAIDVVRALWDAEGRGVRFAGEHYKLTGARPGPAPAHAVEIWLGAYKPRMLRLTGSRADGWLPSLAYASVDALPAMNKAIDEAAVAAGRRPADVRRLYNIDGEFGTGGGFLAGPPAAWAEQLAALTLAQGMSTYILAVSAPDDLRRFAAEVAPAVRELVERERAAPHPAMSAGGPARAAPEAAPLAVTPTPDDGQRLSPERVWDERTRPAGPEPDPARRYTAAEQESGQHLVDIHDGLRAEVARVRDLVGQLAQGTANPTAVRSLLNRMTIRQNNWTLGVYCQSYCRIVTGHHTLEDRSLFPHLTRSDPRLEAVIRRLEEEHVVIAGLLDRVDAALVRLAADEPDALAGVRAAIDVLTDAMSSHLAYEERELVEPLARLGY